LGQAEASLEELRQLAQTCGVAVFDTQIQYRPQPDPKYMVGSGRLSDIDLRATQIGANLLIFDHELTPAQVRSINDFTGLKIIDRTQVILDIFAHRAHSREGKIQVELAQLKYLLPRLMHKDTSLSRLAGGIGGVGPGETKLEIDRRRIRERISRLEKDLKSVAKSRMQRRGRRNKSGLRSSPLSGTQMRGNRRCSTPSRKARCWRKINSSRRWIRKAPGCASPVIRKPLLPIRSVLFAICPKSL